MSIANNKGSTRVVFLIDVAMGRMLDTCERKTLGRAITLTSTRTLLFLSKFPHSRYKDMLKWNYTFYDSQQIDWSLRIRSGNFLELSTYQLECYSCDVFTRLDSCAIKSVNATQPRANLLYNAIGTAIQDYPWDAPFIISPVRPNRASQRGPRRLSSAETEQSNVLFIFTYCPTCKKDLQTFCDLKHTEGDITMETIKSKLFTDDLCSSVTKNNVKIYFVNCNELGKQSKNKDLDGLLLYSEAVDKRVGGKVLELSQFISPLSHNALHRCFSSLDCYGDLVKQHKDNPGDDSQERCHSSSACEEETKSSFTLTYPIQTALTTVISQTAATTVSTCSEQNLLELSENGDTLCILSVGPMLQDGLPLFHPSHYPPLNSFKEQEGSVEAEVVGVIRNTNINLSWLHPTQLYTCTGVGDCSRYFQTLNLWLADNNCVLVVKTKFVSECALLQPITSMISSLIFVKPEYVAALYGLPRTSLTENKLICTEGDAPQCSKQFSSGTFPMEADFCINLDSLFSSDCGTKESQSFLVQSFNPWSLSLPASNILNSDFYAQLHQLAKKEESNHSINLKAFKESLYRTNEESRSNEMVQHQATACTKPAEVLSQAESIDRFKSLYLQCVESDKNDEELFQSLNEAIRKMEDIFTTDELLQFLDQDMLLSHSKLRTKHEAAQSAASETRKINEYQLQVLMYLEAHKRGLRDHFTVAEQLVLLLRGISLMTNTQFLSRYLTEIILANYRDSCADALRLLYEELMLPLPVQLSSPTLDTSYATSDGESPFCSVSKPRISASTTEDDASSCKLKRFKSFHGFPAAKKQITVPVEKKKKKTTKGNKYNLKSNSSRSMFRCARSPFKSPPHSRVGGKNVRRSLFARSKSMVSISHPSIGGGNDKPVNSADEPSHRGIKVDDIVCVQETPLKKQVPNYQQFKLQRTRSKLGKASFPEVNTIQESPYRAVHSFSGGNKSCLLEDTNDNEKDVVSSSDEETDALMSLYLLSPIPASQETEVPSNVQHQKTETLIEAPTDSMLAFKLSTPPKEARLNFLNVTSSY